MSSFKVSDVAKKAEMSVEETVSKFKNAGINVNSGDDSVREEDVVSAGLDSKYTQLDRRQEMLKKALERHKRGVKIKEVVVGKGGTTTTESPQNRKVSKEDLMKKRSELDKRLQKVDEDREIMRDQKENQEKIAESIAKIETPVVDNEKTTIKPVEKEVVETQTNDIVEKTIEPKKPETTEPKPPEVKVRKTISLTQNYPDTSRQQPTTRDQAQGARRPYENRTDSARPQGDRPPSDRPYSGGGYNRGADNRGTDNRGSGGYQRPAPSGSDRQPRTGEANRQYAQRPYGDRNNQGARPPYQGDRPAYQQGTRPPYQGDRPAYQQGTRPPYQGDKPYQSRNQSGSERPGSKFGSPRVSSDRDSSLSLTQDEERKRIVKKKDDNTVKETEAKKPKTKKDLKKTKSWVKTITEGIDELNIEKEIETKPVISPNIDISDLADVDPDKKRSNQNNYRNRFERKTRRKSDGRSQQKVFVRPESVEIGARVVISEFSSLIGVKATELIKKLFAMDVMATVNQAIEAETAQLLGIDYGVEVVIKSITEDDLLPSQLDAPEDLQKRPPIVTVMGHVDHGKTSLLDAIRSTSVATGEAGGITQHIGAYEVESASGKIIFLDTPGHEAFTSLRARGALLTDIVILVVAADDGVKPQTKEAIDHAKAAGVRIIVAINKIDKDGANPDKVRQQLADYGIISEDWGGEYQFQEISAKKRTGIDDLLERILLEAEVLDLKGNPNRDAEGIVIESRLDKQKGPVATVLVKNGTLKKGDTFISGSQFGKVRAMFNFKGAPIKEAGVSIPAEVMGFSEVPEAGEKFIVTDEKIVKQVAELRLNANKEKQRADRGKLSLTDIFSRIKEGKLKELNIVLKADAQGSVEALIGSLLKLSNQEVKVNIIHDGIGAITESDVVLANASKAIIIGFNVRPDNNARQTADKEGVSIELYSIIYKAIDDVKLALEGLLSPEMKENVVGRVEVRQVFSVPKIGKIAGCFVTEGKVMRNSQVRVIRDSIVIFDGKISSLKRFTDDAKEVAAGYECGLSIDKYQDIKENDVLEVYEVIEEKRTLEDVAKLEKAEKAEKDAKAEKEAKAEKAEKEAQAENNPDK